MFGLVIAVHVIACSLLILIVLVQQGKGGGLIDSFSSAESIFGTKTSSFLIKSTSVLAVIFFLTCLGLAFLSIQKSRSLIGPDYKPEKQAVQPSSQEQKQQTPQPSQANATVQTEPVKVQDNPKPVGNEQ